MTGYVGVHRSIYYWLTELWWERDVTTLGFVGNTVDVPLMELPRYIA